MNNETYKQDLIKSFHEQFAINQNNHQSAFIQLLSIILTVVTGFGYAFLNFYKISLFDFTAIFLTAEIILNFGLFLVISYAYGFRRDQLVNTKIRERANIVIDKVSNDYLKIFPKKYNPKKSFIKKIKDSKSFLYFIWMPDFHLIFVIMFIIFQIVTLFIYVLKIWKGNFLFTNTNPDYFSISLFTVGIIFFVGGTIFAVTIYYTKIKKLYKLNKKK